MKNLTIFLLLLVGIWAAEQETIIKDLEQSLVAPCCWSGTVYDHGHAEMEDQIRQMVESGKTKDVIMEYFVAKYGERILASPVASGFNLMAWITPVLIFLIRIAIIVNFLRTPKKVAAESKINHKKVKIPHDAQIERELDSLD